MITLSSRLATPKSDAGVLARCRRTLAVWRRRARARAELARLGDRDLHDIGVTPSEAAAEYNKPFWRP